MYALYPLFGDVLWSNPRTPVRGFAGGLRLLQNALNMHYFKKCITYFFSNRKFFNKIVIYPKQKCIDIKKKFSNQGFFEFSTDKNALPYRGYRAYIFLALIIHSLKLHYLIRNQPGINYRLQKIKDPGFCHYFAYLDGFES